MKKKATKKPTTALVLRCNSADNTSYGGFAWPSEIGAEVTAPDWSPSESCGNGLHGWLYGHGGHSVSDYIRRPDAKWLIVEVVLSDVIALGGKVKFPRCAIRHIGDRFSATEFLIAHEPNAKRDLVLGATATAGYSGTATAGAYGTATAGAYGTATAGYKGTATAGECGEIRIRYYDSRASRYRTAIAYVGENGIKENTSYRLNSAHEFVEVST